MSRSQRLVLVFFLAAAVASRAAVAAEATAAPAPTPVTSQAMVSVTNAGPPSPLGKEVCPVLSEYAEGVPLAHVQAALQPGGHLNILAIGSGTVLGPEVNNPSASFPYHMARALKAASPRTEITLTVRGGKGLAASEMLAIIARDLTASSYQLVLWQTGTVEAVRGLPVDALSDTLAAGAERVEAAGSDLVLIDPQYSRFLRANANLEPYQRALEQAATSPGVNLFHRFDLMHAWVDDGGIDLERAQPSERQKIADTLHSCLGRALARLVLNGAGLHAALEQPPPK